MDMGHMLRRAADEALAREADRRGTTVEALQRERRARELERCWGAELAADAEAEARLADAWARWGAEHDLGRRLGLRNAGAALPLRVAPVEAVQLRQLGARSSGSGRTAAHVVHLQVLDPEGFRSGRIVRRGGDVLCTADWRPWDVHGCDPGTPVTCQGCLAVLARHGRPPGA